MRGTPRLRGLPVFGFAVAGLLLGHAVSYLLAVPDPYHRSLVLQRTGHDYLPVAGEIGLILLLAGVAAVVARAFTSRTRDTERFASLAGLLAVIQVAAFAGQEVLERLASGSPLGELVHDHVLATGVVVQVAVALIGATGLRLLARASARIATSAGSGRVPPPRVAVAAVPPSPVDSPRGRITASAPNVRAPPTS